MFYILENEICMYATPTIQDVNKWLKENNKTIYKVYQDEESVVKVEVK